MSLLVTLEVDLLRSPHIISVSSTLCLWWVVCVIVLMMLDKLTDEQLCYPDSNVSCVRAHFSVGVQVGLYVVFVFDIMVNIVGNSVVILSICHFKQLHSPTNVFVFSLAVVDLLVGLMVLPLSVTRTIKGCWFYGDTICLLHSSTDLFLTSASIFHLVCIAVDRYEAVCNPLRYTSNVTISMAWLMVLTCWSLAALHAYGLIFSKANVAGLEDFLESVYCLGRCNMIFNSLLRSIEPFLFFFFPCTVMLGLYTKIFLVVQKQLRKIEGINQCVNSRKPLSKQSERKAAKTLGIVMGVYIICWLPLILDSIIDHYVGFSTPPTLFQVFNWLAYFNSTLNPIIYAMFYPWFRKCFQLIVTLKIFNQNSSDINLFSS